MFEIEINKDKCDGQGECVEICPTESLSLNNGKCEVGNAEECVGCMSCIEVCSAQAITVTETED